MEPIYVRDYEDLLNGQLLAPIRFDADYNEVDDSYGGSVYLQNRHHRVVYISGGFMTQAYGGPEEGGWYYDHFNTVVEFSLTVYDEARLREALGHVEALMGLRFHGEDTRDLAIFLTTDDYYRPGRQHYE